MKALYLEPDEEITSVIDRLKEIDDTDVAIVIPKRAGILQSIVNLKLLRHQAEQLKKHVSIVTTDKTGRNLASAVGLTVYQRMPEGTEVKESAVKESGEPVPIRFKRGAGPEAVVKKKPEIETHEVKAVKPTPTPAPEPKPEPESAPAAPEPEPEKPAAKSEKPAKSKAEDGSQAAKAAPKARRRRLPKLRLPRIRRLGLVGLILLLLVLVGGGAAAAIVLPKATVDVTPKTDPLAVDVPLSFSAKAPAVDPAKHVVPAKVIEVTVNSSAQPSSTGSPAGGQPAKGDITVVNNLHKDQPLVVHTRFKAPNGKIFRSQSAIVVPAGAEQTVTVVADDGGADGNVPVGTKLTLPGLSSSTAVTGEVKTALSGGTDGQGPKQVTQADADGAKAALTTQAIKDGLSKAKEKLAVGYKLNEQVAETAILNSSVTPGVGTASARFTITGTVKIDYFTYQATDVDKLVTDATRAKVPAGSDWITESTQQTFAPTQASADELTGAMQVRTFTAHQVSRDELKRKIAGQKPGAAADQLKRSGQVKDVQVTLWPFWVTSVPKSLDKIDIRFTAGAATSASPSAAPSSMPSARPSATPSPVHSPAR